MSKKYFRKEHEEAIVEYCSTRDREKRSQLYEDNIDEALVALIEKIVNTYKFNNLPNISELKHDCRIDMISIFEKYDPEKGSAAFSYFTVCVLNWFRTKAKKVSKRNSILTTVDNEAMYEVLETGKDSVYEEDPIHRLQESYEFVDFFKERFVAYGKTGLDEDEKKVHKAILFLLDNEQSVDIITRRGLQRYICEITMLPREEVFNIVKHFRDFFERTMWEWNNEQ